MLRTVQSLHIIHSMEKLTISAGLSKRFSKKSESPKEKYLHSKDHVLADELSNKLGEPKRFGLYLRMAKKYNHDFLRRIAGDILEKGAKNPGALFAFLVKKERLENDEITNKKVS